MRCNAKGRLRRAMASLVTLVAVVIAADVPTLACSICFQVQESATTDGIRAAVLVLLGVTTVVLGGFARFVVGVARRQGQALGEAPVSGVDGGEP